jgi:hypothetical protein
MAKYDEYSQREIEFTVKHLMQLEGGTITHVGVAVEDFNEGISDKPMWEVLPVLTVTKDDKTYQVVVLQDPEGNGPGWLDIDEVPSA